LARRKGKRVLNVRSTGFSRSLEIGHFRSAIRALFGVRRQSAGRRSHAATALWLRSPTKALDEVSCLTIQSKAASRFACRRSPKDASDPGTGFVDSTPEGLSEAPDSCSGVRMRPFRRRLCAPQMPQNVQSPDSRESGNPDLCHAW